MLQVRLFFSLLLLVGSSFGVTRLYMPNTDTFSSLTPGFAGWSTTTGAVRRYLAPFKDTSDTVAAGATITCNAAANSTCLDRQYISPPLSGAQTISGTVKGYWMVKELATTDDIDRWPVTIRVLQSDGTTYRCTVLALADASPGVNETGTTLVNRVIADGDSLSSCAAQDGDRIVVEVGYQVDATGGTTPQGASQFGTSATDCAENETGTTSCSPWVEFSQDLTFQIYKTTSCKSADSAAAATTSTATCTAPADSLAICGLGDDDNGSSTSISGISVAGSPTYSTAWTSLNRQVDNGFLNTEVWYAYTTSGWTSQVVTATLTSSEKAGLSCAFFKNVDSTTPIPAFQGDHSAAGVSKNSVTVANSGNTNSRYAGIYTCGDNTARSTTAGTGYTKENAVNDSVANAWAHITFEIKDQPVASPTDTVVNFGAYGCNASGLTAEGIIGFELKLTGGGGGAGPSCPKLLTSVGAGC